MMGKYFPRILIKYPLTNLLVKIKVQSAQLYKKTNSCTSTLMYFANILNVTKSDIIGQTVRE